MLKAWQIYKSKTLGCDCMVADDDRLHDENCKCVTVKMMDSELFTIISKDDLEEIDYSEAEAKALADIDNYVVDVCGGWL